MKEIYVCDSCHYLFEADEDIDRCPDCGKRDIRPANEQEREEYLQLRIEFGYVKYAG